MMDPEGGAAFVASPISLVDMRIALWQEYITLSQTH
jgi:hypothetical protein